MTQLSSFQPLPLPPGPASAACTQLTPFPSCWAFPTMLTTRFYPSSYRVRSFPLPRKPASFRSPIGLPLHPSPFSATRRDPTLSGYWQLVCPLSKSVRGPIPTRHHATSETSVQSPLWKKNTSLAPALFLLFLLFSISVRVYPCLFPIFVCAHPASPPLPACRHDHFFSPPTPGLCSFLFVQWLVPSCSLSSESFFRGSSAISLLYIRCQAEQCNVIQVQRKTRIENPRNRKCRKGRDTGKNERAMGIRYDSTNKIVQLVRQIYERTSSISPHRLSFFFFFFFF